MELTWGDASYKVTLFVAVLGFIGFLAALYLAEFIIRLVFGLLFGWIKNRKQRLAAKSVRLAEQGLRTEVAGNYHKAQRLLQKAVKYAPDPIFALTQTFELAIRNKDLITARKALQQAAAIASDKDQQLLEICRLKYYVAQADWDQAYALLHPVMLASDTEEVNLIAAKVYTATGHYGYLEDQIVKLQKQGWIDNDQATELTITAAKGIIDQQLAKDPSPQALVDWFNNLTKVRSRNVLYRNALMAKLAELGEVQLEATIAAESFYLCKIDALEATNFVDLVNNIKQDTEYRLLTKAIERKFKKFNEVNQDKLLKTLVTLLYSEGNLKNAQQWLDKLFGENAKQLVSSPDSLLLAQAIYRKLGVENQLGAINNLIDAKYLPENKAEEAQASTESNAEASSETNPEANAETSTEASSKTTPEANKQKDA